MHLELHVRSGSRQGDGSVASPFASLDQARDAIRRLPRPWQGDVRVCVHGQIALRSPFLLGPEDSGQDGHRVRWSGSDGATIGAPLPVTGWRLYDASRRLWCAPAPAAPPFRQLWADGRRLVRCRSRANPGWLGDPAGYSRTNIGRWRNLRGIEVVARVDWKEFRGLVDRVEQERTVMRQPYWHNAQMQPPWNAGLPTWIENAWELLGEPGQWYLDPAAGLVWYVPLPGEDPADMAFTAPGLERLIEADGLRDCTFSNLTFADATWRWGDPDSGYCEVQSGTRIVGGGWTDFDATRDHWQHLPACLQFTHCHGLAFTGCTFTRLGGAGLHLSRGCQDCAVEDCTFSDISASGLVLGRPEDHHPAEVDVTADLRISRNRIAYCGAEYRSCAGLLAYWVAGVVIERNEICELPYTGISIGWGWGMKDAVPSVMQGNRITGNRIRRCMLELFDGAGIYSLSAQPGQRITGNWVDGWSGVGIYLDNGSRYNHVEGNVVTGLHESVSARNDPNRDNVITGNWFSGVVNAGDGNRATGNQPLDDGQLPEAAAAICLASGR